MFNRECIASFDACLIGRISRDRRHDPGSVACHRADALGGAVLFPERADDDAADDADQPAYPVLQTFHRS